MSQFGLRIKNISAGTLYGYNLGIRSYYEYTNAMFHNSLFSDFIKEHGLQLNRGDSTRDIICINFDFGLRDYEDEVKHIEKLNVPDEKREQLLAEVEANKEKYVKTSRDEIRRIFYNEGVDVKYDNETIHYKMLYRNASKAKIGQAMFINEKLYDVAYDWLTMGLGVKMPEQNAKIVELSAYAPLTTSTIVDKFNLPLENVLIVKDAESSYFTRTKVVKEQKRDDIDDYMCVVENGVTKVTNVLWDGMGLVDKSICSENINGMMLLRNHFFKACAFKTDIELFYRDWCAEHGVDYETYEVQDMYGNTRRLKDIKLITTENAIKWGKFADLMGDNPYEYWRDRVEANGCMWGIVKTDHPSKLNEVQQMSYQMINTLPCSEEEIVELADISTEYLTQLKENDEVFVEFLRRYATAVNHYSMMADLYEWNPGIGRTGWYRSERQKIIRSYVNRLKKGKITIKGDNLTVCGNPYALLMHTVGEDFNEDCTLNFETGVIQCYTKMFEDGEYLCAIRNPHNSPNNLCYLHNRYSPQMEKYFCFSNNILAVNCIHTDIQDRANGCDFDLTQWVSVQKCA